MIIHGTSGSDTLSGTASNDTIYGYAGNDTITGGGGSDTIYGGSGFNTINGGAGDDSVMTDGLTGAYDGGAGQDTMFFHTIGAGGIFDLLAGTGRFGTLFSMTNFENIVTGAGSDSISGTDGRNVVSAGAGNDTVLGRGGGDVLYGEAGNDIIDGGAGSDTLEGGDGNDLLWGGAGDDTMTGGKGNDTIDGGESGYDTASYAGHGGAVTASILTSKATSVVGGVAETDFLFRIDKVIGSSHGDQLVAGAATALDGGAGNDSIWSGSGANVLAGGSGVDTLSYHGSTAGVQVDIQMNTAQSGWAQGDVISGFENLYGSTHFDVMRGTSGANTLFGNAGADDLFGAGGADQLIGGAGADDLWGGTGADQFLFMTPGDSPYAGAIDIIRDFNRAQGDRIDLSGIDANLAVAGIQDFTKLMTGVATPGFSGAFTAGTIAVKHSGGHTYLDINTSDAVSSSGFDAPEMQIRLDGIHSLALSDVIL